MRPEHLAKPDLLVDGASIDEFRSTLQKFGCDLQRKSNQVHCETLSKDKCDDSINGFDSQRHNPFLVRFCCPPSKRAIQGFLQIALLMANDGDPSILNLPKHGGVGHGKRLVAVVPGDTPKTFYKNGKGWLPRLCDAIGGNNMSRHDVCFWLTKLHRFHERKAFDDACRTSSAASFKMDPHRQIAMFHKNNLTNEHARGMRPHSNADGCNPLNSERVIRKLEVSPSITPVFTSFLEKGKQRHSWHLPAKDVVEEELQKKNLAPDEIHVVLSADHGQRAFRVNVAVVQIKSGRAVAETNVLVGHIDCRKDTTDVVRDSRVLSSTNTSLKELRTSRQSIKLCGTGDLAWCSLVLGKPSMAGQHCWKCMSRLKDHQKCPRFVGRPWTLHLMKQTHEKLESGQLKRKEKDQERGIMEEPSADCIEPSNWLFPPLHGLDLLTNTPFSCLQRWTWNRLEDIPLPLIDLRDKRTKCAVEVDKLWDEVVDTEAHKLAMKEELRAIEPSQDGDFEDDDHEDEWQRQKEILQAATDAVTVASDLHTAAKKEHKKLNAEVNEMEKDKDCGKTARELWLQVERMLRQEFNVYASTYHRGDMEGNECRRLLRFASEAMARAKQMLMSFLATLSDEERKKRATASETNLFTSAFERLFQHMDVMSHCACQPFGSLTDEDIRILERCVFLATNLWKKLLPTVPMKVHAWLHFVEDMKHFRGLKSHNEQGIERAHQTGKKHDKRLACLREHERKALNILKLTATSQAKEVVAMHADTLAKKKKHKKDAAIGTAKSTSRHSYIVEVVNRLPIGDDIPSLVDLAKATMIGQADS